MFTAGSISTLAGETTWLSEPKAQGTESRNLRSIFLSKILKKNHSFSIPCFPNEYVTAIGNSPVYWGLWRRTYILSSLGNSQCPGVFVHELSIDFLLIIRSPISGWQSNNNAVNSRTSTHCLTCFCEVEDTVTGKSWGIETNKVAKYWKEYHVSHL